MNKNLKKAKQLSIAILVILLFVCSFIAIAQLSNFYVASSECDNVYTDEDYIRYGNLLKSDGSKSTKATMISNDNITVNNKTIENSITMPKINGGFSIESGFVVFYSNIEHESNDGFDLVSVTVTENNTFGSVTYYSEEITISLKNYMWINFYNIEEVYTYSDGTNEFEISETFSYEMPMAKISSSINLNNEEIYCIDASSENGSTYNAQGLELLIPENIKTILFLGKSNFTINNLNISIATRTSSLYIQQ